MMICGAHFPFPGLGSFVKDGSGYAFTAATPVTDKKPGLRPYPG